MDLTIIAAVCKNGVIGPISWHYPQDMKRFKKLTLNHYLIVGRKTYDTLPELKNRTLVVVSKVLDHAVPGAKYWIARTPQEAVCLAMTESAVRGGGEVFVIGGAQIYEVLLPYATKAYITRLPIEPEGDVLFPEWPSWPSHWLWRSFPQDEGTTLDIGVRIS